MLLPALPPQPAIVAPAPSPQEAEAALLDAFDWGRPLPEAPRLKGKAALEYHWLRAAATFDPAMGLPSSPFTAGPEAEAIRRLMKAPKARMGAALKAITLHRSGTALALWRWGQVQVRTGAFDAPLRRIWEDRLLAAGPALTRGYALRHALCWSLAEKDEARFLALRSGSRPETEDTLKGFQRLFGLLGGPSPTLRLWDLPDLGYQDRGLDQLGVRRIWICPAENETLQVIPADTVWIIPSETGSLNEREASLTESLLAEGQPLALRLRAAGRKAHFAPSRPAFERLGLSWFPILMELDAQGAVQSIQMGDAAPRRP